MSGPVEHPPTATRSPTVSTWFRVLPRRDWQDYDYEPAALKPWHFVSCAIVSAFGMTLAGGLSYLDGYLGDLMGESLLGPLVGLPSFVLGLIALGMCIWSLIRRKFVRTVLRTLAALVALWALAAVLLPESPYFLGLRHRLSNAMTPDQWRAVAAKANALLGSEPRPDGHELPGPGTDYYRYPDVDRAWRDPLWAEFSALPGFGRLGDRVTVSSRDGIVEIAWIARESSQGVRVASTVTKLDRDVHFWPMAPDIAVFVRAD